MFLDFPLAALGNRLLEAEDYPAIDALYRQQMDDPAAQWTYLRALLAQTRVQTAWQFTGSIQPSQEDSTIFRLQREFLALYNGQPSSLVPEILAAIIQTAEDNSVHPKVKSWGWHFAGATIELGITLGRLSSTSAKTAVEYYSRTILPEDPSTRFTAARKIIALELAYPFLEQRHNEEAIACLIEEAQGHNLHIQSAELCLLKAATQFAAQYPREPLQTFKMAGQLFELGGHKAGKARVSEHRGTLLLEYAQPGGIRLLEEAITIYSNLGQHHRIRAPLQQLQAWYTETADREKIGKLDLEIKKAAEAIELPAAAGSPDIARLRRALETDDMDTILKIGQSITSDQEWVIQNVYQLMSNALATNGRLREAIDLSSRVVGALEMADPNPVLAFAYTFLADQHTRAKEFTQAHACLGKAEQMYARLMDLTGIAAVTRRALEYYVQEAVNKNVPLHLPGPFIDSIEEVIGRLNDRHAQKYHKASGGIYQAMGQAYATLNNEDMALSCYQAAEKIFLDHHLVADAAGLWPHMALLWISIARAAKSIDTYNEALAYIEKAIRHSMQGLRQMLFRFYFHKGICLFESGRLLSGEEQKIRFDLADESFDKAAGYITEMFRMLDNSSVASRQEAFSFFVGDKQNVYEQAFILNYHYRGDLARALYWVQLQKMQSILAELSGKEQSAADIQDNFDYAAILEKLREKESDLGGPNIVIYEYYCIQENIYVFTIRSDWDSPTAERVPLSVSQVRERQHDFLTDNRLVRAAAEGYKSEWWQALQPLVQTVTLWSRPGDIVYMIPHGALQNLPIHTLQVEKTLTLAERNPVLWAPSLAILFSIWRREKDAGLNDRPRLVMGDASGNLPWAEQEVRRLATLFGQDPILREQVSKAKFLDSLTDASLVHYCGHGYFVPGQGLESYIEMAGGQRITPRDLMPINVQPGIMVVLSGCETGLNQALLGDELMGLSRGFMLAGVDTLIVSLWKVNDQHTLHFFELFYTYLSRTKNKALAMQKVVAQMKTEGYSFFSWGAFVIIGDC